MSSDSGESHLKRVSGKAVKPLWDTTGALFWGAIAGILFFIYFALIQAAPILDWDDRYVLDRAPSTWNGFITALGKPTLSDYIIYPPLMDLSFYLDRVIQGWVGLQTFHLTQVLIWLAVLFQLGALVRKVFPERKFAPAIAVGLAAVHPVFVNTVSWLAARRHLFCAFFLLAVTRWAWEISDPKKKDAELSKTGLMILFYGLSVLSHPIGIFWPIFYLALCICRKSPAHAYRAFLVLAPLLGWVFVLNYSYFSERYILDTGATKFLSSHPSHTGLSMLAWGRYVFNFFFPFRLAPLYWPGAIWNSVGIAVLALAISLLIGLGRHAWRTWAPWFIAGALPLLVVTTRMTRIFVMDSYFVQCGLFLCLLIGNALGNGIAGTNSKAVLIRGSIFGCFLSFALISHLSAREWSSERSLWEWAQRVERTPASLAAQARFEIYDRDFETALKSIEELREMDPEFPVLPRLACRAVKENPNIAQTDKVRWILDHRNENPWFDYCLGVLRWEQGQVKDAFQDFTRALATPEPFKPVLSQLTAEATFLCEMAKASSCDQIKERIKNSKLAPALKEEAYQARLEVLRLKAFRGEI